MRRDNNSLNSQIVLFIGNAKLIANNGNNQISLAHRTIVVNEKSVYTYITGTLNESKLNMMNKSKKSTISAEQLMNYQFEYKVSPYSKVKLIISNEDKSVEAFLKELKLAYGPKDQNNIVAVINFQDKSMNGFIFKDQSDAVQFCQAYNCVLMFQKYTTIIKKKNIPFNYRILNMLSEGINGRLMINPVDFQDDQEKQIELVIQILNELKEYDCINLRSKVFQFSLRFKIIDDKSLGYAHRFIFTLPNKIQKLSLNSCEITNSTLHRIFFQPNHRLADKLTSLQQIDLSQNHLSDDIFSTLSNLLKCSPSLHCINLAKNDISLEKQPLITEFLRSINKYQMELDISNNRVTNYKFIIKYLINADGNVPIHQLVLSGNPILKEDITMVIRAYMAKCKAYPNYKMKLILQELELEEPQCFQYLVKEYTGDKPKIMSIPVTLSKMPSKKNISKYSKNKAQAFEQLSQKQIMIDGLLKQYGIAVLMSNFYKMSKIKGKLLELGMEEEYFAFEFNKMKEARQRQQKMISTHFNRVLNFQQDQHVINTQLDLLIKMMRRKGLQGNATVLACVVKAKRDNLILSAIDQRQTGTLHQEIFFKLLKKPTRIYHHYAYLQDTFLSISHAQLSTIHQNQLYSIYLQAKKSDQLTLYFSALYILLDQFTIDSFKYIVEYCLIDPKLSSVKIFRNANSKTNGNGVKCIADGKVRITDMVGPAITNKMDHITIYSIENYAFSLTFKESGQSSHNYNGILSPLPYQSEREKEIMAFIQIVNNFLNFMYYTPKEISTQSAMYLQYIVNYINNLPIQTDRDQIFIKIIIEQLFIHMITYFHSQLHQPLQNGIMASICQFLCSRLQIEEYTLNYLIAHLMKTQTIPIQQIKIIHKVEQHKNKRNPTPTKVVKIDWINQDPLIMQSLLMRRGIVSINICDITKKQVYVTIQMHQTETIDILWKRLSQMPQKLQKTLKIQKGDLSNYWLYCKDSTKEFDRKIKPLHSYNYIGQVICKSKLQSNSILLKKTIFTPQQHNIHHLQNQPQQDLLSLYSQSKYNFLHCAGVIWIKQSEKLKNAIYLLVLTEVTLIQKEKLVEFRSREYVASCSKSQFIQLYSEKRRKIIENIRQGLQKEYIPDFTEVESLDIQSVLSKLEQEWVPQTYEKINIRLKECILCFMQCIGIIGYSAMIFSQLNDYAIVANNSYLIVYTLSNMLGKPTINNFYRLHWRNIINVKFIENEDKFDLIIQYVEITFEKRTITVQKMKLKGDDFWKIQSFLLFNKISKCRLRYNYSNLFQSQENDNFLYNDEKKYQKTQNKEQGGVFLQITDYVSLKVPRKSKITNNNIQSSISKSKEKQKDKDKIAIQKQKQQTVINKIQIKPDIKQPQKEIQVDPQKMQQIHPQMIPPLQKSQQNPKPQEQVHMNQILQKVGNENAADEITTQRRSTRKDGPKRRSTRNR